MTATPILISALDDLTTPDLTDALVVVTNMATTPVTKRAQLGNLLAKQLTATAAEINTGTETGKYVTPDAIAGSITGTKYLCKWIPGNTAVADGIMYIPVPEWAWNVSEPYDLTSVEATVDVAGTTNSTTIQLNNLTNDLLSTAMTIETGEYTSKDSETAAVIDADHKSLSGIKRVRVDIDGISTTPASGLTVILGIRRP